MQTRLTRTEPGPSWTSGLMRLQPTWLRALILACLCFSSAPSLAQEESAQAKGLRIALESSARNDGFGDFSAGMTMVLRDRHGRESVRQMRFKVLEVPGDGDKSLFVFDQPKDVQGTGTPEPRPRQLPGRPVAVLARPEASEAHQARQPVPGPSWAASFPTRT